MAIFYFVFSTNHKSFSAVVRIPDLMTFQLGDLPSHLVRDTLVKLSCVRLLYPFSPKRYIILIREKNQFILMVHVSPSKNNPGCLLANDEGSTIVRKV